MNSLPPDRPKFPLPEPVPELVIGPVRDTGVEACLNESPAGLSTQAVGQPSHVIVRMVVAKGNAGSVKQILAVDEDHRALEGGLDRAQCEARRKK